MFDFAPSPENLAVRGLGRHAKILRRGIPPAASWEADDKGSTDDDAQKYLAQAKRQIAELAVQMAAQRAIIKQALDMGQRLEMAESLLDAPTRVLVVEDDAVQRERMRGWLEGPQWTVREAENGREALNRIQETSRT